MILIYSFKHLSAVAKYPNEIKFQQYKKNFEIEIAWKNEILEYVQPQNNKMT